MVVRVKFKGLKIANARGKYYVYRRETGEPLIKGFIGSRAELLQKLEDPEFIQVYNRPRLLKRRAGDFPIETLGGFIITQLPEAPVPGDVIAAGGFRFTVLAVRDRRIRRLHAVRLPNVEPEAISEG